MKEDGEMGMELWMTRAGIGDCILVRCGEERKVNILIDSGQGAGALESVLKRIARRREQLDLLVLTHDDNDHVKGACNLLKRLYASERPPQKDCGIKKLFSDLEEERILFNFGGNGTDALLAAEDVRELSHVLEGELDFHRLGFVLADAGEGTKGAFTDTVQLQWDGSASCGKSVVKRRPDKTELRAEKEHLELVILSPKKETLLHYIESAWRIKDQETLLGAGKAKGAGEWEKSIQYWMKHPMELGGDKKPANNASISFLLFYKNFSALFAGDASPEDMTAAGRNYLRRIGSAENAIRLDFIKLPHHGSSHNVNREFLTFFQTKSYLISTSGHAGYKHPGKGALAEIASVLGPGEKADIYSSYDWWRGNPAFWEAEMWERNWKGNRCELRDKSGGIRYLDFHKLETEQMEIGDGIWIGS